MALSFPLDNRQAQLVRALLARNKPASLSDLGTELRLSHRVVRYNLDAVDGFLDRSGLRLVRRRGVGVWIDGDAEARENAVRRVEFERGPQVFDVADRVSLILLALLEAAPEPVRSGALEARLGVSRPTVRRDVRVAETWLEQHRLHLRRLPGVGLAVRGSELDVRAGLLALLLERAPGAVTIRMTSGSLAQNPAGPESSALASYIDELELEAVNRILATELGDASDRDATILTATAGLAIQLRRISRGRNARLARARLRSFLDHPVSDTARRIVAVVEDQFGVALGSVELAAVTELLLGFIELSDSGGVADTQVDDVVDRMMRGAAAGLGASLRDDDLLRANLVEHIRRLRVRLRYGLPLSNPLRDEVRKRYPDVYRAAEQILSDIGRIDGAQIPDEEASFLTMYLAGSVERHSLRPKTRVTVVCPAGMATAWILVSRLLSEFPQLEIAQVLSKTTLEQGPDAVSTDLIVSTIPLADTGDLIPSLVVSPLLSERDVRRLSRILGQAPRA